MSPRAACRLRALGFERVYDYVDGIADWKAAGFPIEGASTPAPRVADAMRTDVPTCLPDETLAAVKPRVVDGDWVPDHLAWLAQGTEAGKRIPDALHPDPKPDQNPG